MYELEKSVKRYFWIFFIFVTYLIYGVGSPDYWNSDKFLNLGDTLFPFDSKIILGKIFYSWEEFGNFGLGTGKSQYRSTCILFYYALFHFFSILQIPLWIQNRLYYFLPTFFILICSYHLILTLVKGRYKYIASFWGAIFVATMPPNQYLDPKVQIPFAGLIIILTITINILKNNKTIHYRSIILFSLGFSLTLGMPRYTLLYLMLAFLLIPVYYFFYTSKKLEINYQNIIKFITISVVMVFLINSYTILPLLDFFSNYTSTDLFSQHESNERIGFYNHFGNYTTMKNTIRLFIDIPPSKHYLEFNVMRVTSFIFLIFLFIPVFIKKKIREIYIVSIFIFILLFICEFFWNTEIHKSLIKIIPGFWILNNPNYYFQLIGLLYSVLLSYSLILIYKKLKDRFHIIITIGIVFLIVIINEPFFFDKLPEKRMSDKVNFAMGHKLPYMKIPDEYWDLNESFPRNELHTRMLITPQLNYQYLKYSWWSYFDMTDILAIITNFKYVGTIHYPNNRLGELYYEVFWLKKIEKLVEFKKFGIQYFFLHKDVLKTPPYRIYSEEPNIRKEDLDKVEALKIIQDNKYFTIYKYKDTSVVFDRPYTTTNIKIQNELK